MRNNQAEDAALAAAKRSAKKEDDDALDDYNMVPDIKVIRTSDLVRTVRVFAACTSAHGLAHLNHPMRSCQIGWTLLIIGAFVGVSINLSTSLVKYQSEPTSTKISPRGSRYVPPDITICNKRMFGMSRIFSRIPDDYSSTNTTIFNHEISSDFRPIYESVQKVRKILETSVKRYLTMKFGNYQYNTDLLRLKEETIYNLPNLIIRGTFGIKYLSQFSTDPAQMLLSCTYGTQACDLRDFLIQPMAANPSCLTFNSKRFDQLRPNVTISILNELSMVLYLDSFNQSPNITDSLLKLPGDWFNMQSPGGAAIFVHPQGTYPTHGSRIEAPVNQETTVDIRYLQYTSKSTRNSRCQTQPLQLQYLVLDDQSQRPANFSSQLADCYVAVMQEVLYQKCGFIDPTLPVSVPEATQPRRGNLSYLIKSSGASVNITNPAGQIDYVYQLFKQSSESEIPSIISTLLDNEVCLQAVRIAVNSDPRMLRCTDNCQTPVFTTSIMPAEWPGGSYTARDFLLPLVQRSLQSNAYYTNGSRDTGASAKKINEVFLEQANWNLYESYRKLKLLGDANDQNYLSLKFRVADAQGLGMQTEESFSYELYDLLSDLGGLLGLYVGISVLTCCEVAELFLQLAVMIGMLIHKRRTRSAPVWTPPLIPSRRVSMVAKMSMQMNTDQASVIERKLSAWQFPYQQMQIHQQQQQRRRRVQTRDIQQLQHQLQQQNQPQQQRQRMYQPHQQHPLQQLQHDQGPQNLNEMWCEPSDRHGRRDEREHALPSDGAEQNLPASRSIAPAVKWSDTAGSDVARSSGRPAFEPVGQRPVAMAPEFSNTPETGRIQQQQQLHQLQQHYQSQDFLPLRVHTQDSQHPQYLQPQQVQLQHPEHQNLKPTQPTRKTRL